MGHCKETPLIVSKFILSSAYGNHEIILRQAQGERQTYQMSNYETASNL
jgi:hypothetical protein